MRRGGQGLLGAIVLALIAAVLVKYCIGPWLLARRVRSALSAVWDGPVRIRAVDFGLTGRCGLFGLELLDRDGHRWGRVGSVRLVLSGMYGWRGSGATCASAPVAADRPSADAPFPPPARAAGLPPCPAAWRSAT
ncbi:MAG: hypothetical protein B1H04_02385 [Planctomycetales bacterium 4484_123]|nr:MAG: hypothetical protein B1H04_02385 [Planctomycetales bacterium 4484_123]